MKFIAVAGTGGLYRDDWWHLDSPFTAFLAQQGIQHAKPDDVFIWSTDVNGIGSNPFKFFNPAHHSDWEAGGNALRYYAKDISYEDRNIICHSHGLQVVLYSYINIRSLISVGSPVRKDMLGLAKELRPKIQSW
jgi:hypothetical protein